MTSYSYIGKRGVNVDTEIFVKKAKQGDKDALVRLIIEKKEDYFKLAYLYMKNKEDALDAMEDMIVILYENIYKLKKNEAFYSWSKTILVNCCKKTLKQKKKLISIDAVEERAYEGDFDKKNDELLIERHLHRLKDKHREVIKLRYFLDLDYQSISYILNIPLGTVKSRIAMGLKKLKESIRGEGYEGY